MSNPRAAQLTASVVWRNLIILEIGELVQCQNENAVQVYVKKFRKICTLSAKNWIKLFLGKNPVKLRENWLADTRWAPLCRQCLADFQDFYCTLALLRTCRALVQAFHFWQAGIEQRRTPQGKRKSQGILQALSSTALPCRLTEHQITGRGESSSISRGKEAWSKNYPPASNFAYILSTAYVTKQSQAWIQASKTMNISLFNP